MKADAVFEAQSIDDALIKLKQHFGRVQKGKDSSLFLAGSEIHVKPDESSELPPLQVKVEETPIIVKHGLT